MTESPTSESINLAFGLLTLAANPQACRARLQEILTASAALAEQQEAVDRLAADQADLVAARAELDRRDSDLAAAELDLHRRAAAVAKGEAELHVRIAQHAAEARARKLDEAAA